MHFLHLQLPTEKRTKKITVIKWPRDKSKCEAHFSLPSCFSFYALIFSCYLLFDRPVKGNLSNGSPLALKKIVKSRFLNHLGERNLVRKFGRFEKSSVRKIGIPLSFITHSVFVLGEVKVSYLKRPYFVTVTTYQMAVILLFNEKTSLQF